MIDTKRLGIFLLFIILSISLVSAAVDASQFYATLDSQRPEPVGPGNYVELRFTVENRGETQNKIIFELLPEHPLSLLESDDGTRDAGTILGNQYDENALQLYYKLKVDPQAVAGNATVKLRYKIATGVYVQFDEFKITIREPHAFLTIDVVDTEPQELLPGRVGYIKVGLSNYAKFTMRNVWLTLDTEDMPFSGFESSNERFIPKIDAGETIYETFKVIVDGDAESKVHNTPIKLEYEDDIGTEYDRDVEVGLVVNERPKYLMNIEESTVLYEDQTGEVVFSISNTGTADMNFAILELLPADNEEYEVISAPKVYVGNLESDDFETIDYKIHINGVEENAVPFNLVLTYKDNFNSLYEDEHQLLFKIYSKRKAGKLGLAEVTGIGGYIFYLMIFVLIVVFTIFMVLDWMHNKMPRYKRILWLIVILTPGIGALAYYFFGRKKAEV